MMQHLMHPDIPVAEVRLPPVDGSIVELGEILCRDRMPLGTVAGGVHPVQALSDWWARRAIPATRMGLDRAMGRIGYSNPGRLLVHSRGMGMSDCYWVGAADDTTWADTNFRDNPSPSDPGDLLFGADPGREDAAIGPMEGQIDSLEAFEKGLRSIVETHDRVRVVVSSMMCGTGKAR